MGNPLTDFNAIAEAIKESIDTGNEGLLDALMQDYQNLITRLASTKQFSAIYWGVSVVCRGRQVNDLINRKDSLSPSIFCKALRVTEFGFADLKDKVKARQHNQRRTKEDDNLPPNAAQSVMIAKAFILSQKDDLPQLIMGVGYFSKMGHHQALAVLLEHYFVNDMAKDDQDANVIMEMSNLKIGSALHPSISKVLKASEHALLILAKLAYSRLISKKDRLFNTKILPLPLIEALHDAGLQDPAKCIAQAFVSLLLVNGDNEITCTAHRIRRLGVNVNDFVHDSRISMSASYPSAVSHAWIEDLLANPEIDIEQLTAALSGFNFSRARENAGFKACIAVLQLAKSSGNKLGLDHDQILSKAIVMCNIEIDQRLISADSDALKSVLHELDFPKELIFKVQRFKGYHLENELGL